MDGARKFVKGDAIAGIPITAINLIGGLLLGLANGMTLADAAETFSILSIGDALVRHRRRAGDGGPRRWTCCRSRSATSSCRRSTRRWAAPWATRLRHFRRQLALDLGVVIPPVHIRDSLQLPHAYELLGRGELQYLFDVFSRTTPKLVEQLVPNLLSFADVQNVMRTLLREGVSVRDLPTILESLIELAPQTRDAEQLTEHLRQCLSRQITAALPLNTLFSGQP